MHRAALRRVWPCEGPLSTLRQPSRRAAERLDLRYADLAAAVADEPGGDRLDDPGVGQRVDDGDHRAEVDDPRRVRAG